MNSFFNVCQRGDSTEIEWCYYTGRIRVKYQGLWVYSKKKGYSAHSAEAIGREIIENIKRKNYDS